MSGITTWLQRNGLDRYASVFQEHHIDFDIIRDLTEADLRSIGIPLGDCKRILRMRDELPAGPVGQRQITVLLVDVVNYTRQSQDPDREAFRRRIVQFRNSARRAIERYEGYVHQYRGDAVMAYFNYPSGQERSAERAVLAALTIIADLRVAHVRGLPELRVHVGVATGEVIIGAEIESDSGKLHENAFGTAPNLAARLQQLAAPDEVLVCPLTRRLTQGYIECSHRGVHDLKGFDAPMRIYRAERALALPAIDRLSKNALTPFQGRTAELDTLLACWERARKEPVFVCLTGDAGIGKSRLVREFRSALAPSPDRQLTYSCSPFHTQSSLHPVVFQIRLAAEFEDTDDDDRRRKKLENLLRSYGIEGDAHLGAFLSLMDLQDRAATEVPAREAREGQFAAMTSLVLNSIQRGSLLILMDDFHWSDPTTQEYLVSLIATLRDRASPCMFVLSARPEYQRPADEADWVDIRLGPLDRLASALLVRHVNPVADLIDEVVDEIVAKTDGLPLFIEETTKAVLETTRRRAAEHESAALGVPPTLKDSLMLRLDRLPSAKYTAQAAAAVGRPFRLDLLSLVLAEGNERLQRDLDALVDAGTLRVRLSPDGPAYEFSHSLLRDLAYESLLPSARRDLHSSVADVLMEDSALQALEPETIARHLAEAQRFELAAEYWIAAGHNASRRSALREAVHHFQSALQTLDRLPESASRIAAKVDVLSGLAGPLLATTSYRSHAVKETAERALTLCRTHGLSQALPPFLYNIWIGEQGDGNHGYALTLAREFLDVASRNATDVVARMVAHRAVGWSEFNLGRPEDALRHFVESRALYDAERHQDLMYVYGTDQAIGLGCGLVQALWCLGQPSEAFSVARETQAAADNSGHALSLFLAHQYTGCLLGSLHRDWAAVKHHATELRRLGEKEFVQARLVGQFYSNVVLTRESRSRVPLEAALRVLSAAKQLGYLYMMPFWSTLVADACLSAELLDDAIVALDDSDSITGRTHEAWHRAETLRIRADVHAALGEPSRAAPLWRESIRCAREQGARAWELRTLTSVARYREVDIGEDVMSSLRASLASFDGSASTSDTEIAQALCTVD